jgi:hypothetical protein
MGLLTYTVRLSSLRGEHLGTYLPPWPGRAEGGDASQSGRRLEGAPWRVSDYVQTDASIPRSDRCAKSPWRRSRSDQHPVTAAEFRRFVSRSTCVTSATGGTGPRARTGAIRKAREQLRRPGASPRHARGVLRRRRLRRVGGQGATERGRMGVRRPRRPRARTRRRGRVAHRSETSRASASRGKSLKAARISARRTTACATGPPPGKVSRSTPRPHTSAFAASSGRETRRRVL